MMGGILIDDSYDSVRSAKENRVPAKANPPTRLPLLVIARAEELKKVG